MRCAAYVKNNLDAPDEPGLPARKGTYTHNLSEHKLGAGPVPSPDEDFVDDVGQLERWADAYVEYVEAIPGRMLVENRVSYDMFAPGGFGTADVIVFGHDGVTHIVDLKTGVWQVDATSEQLKIYALGVILTFGGLFDIDKIKLHIFQPSLDHISVHETSAKEILAWAEMEVRPQVEDALSDDPTYVAGEKQCRWCHFRPKCRALFNWRYKTFVNAMAAITKVEETTLAEVEILLNELEGFEDFRQQLKGRLFEAMHKNDYPAEHFKLVRGVKHRAWINADLAKEKLRDEHKLKVKDITETKLRSPAQLEGLVKNRDEFDKLWIQPEGEITIAHKSDRRREVSRKQDVIDGFASLISTEETLSNE